MKKMKKGFTIVELVIVIAVIAILAGVLIPTFSSVIKKARINADTQVVRNLNTSLSASEAIDGKAEDFSEVIQILKEDGYVIANLNPTTDGWFYVWESASNQMLLVDENYDIQYKAKDLTATEPGATWYFAISNETVANQVKADCPTANIERPVSNGEDLSAAINANGEKNVYLDSSIEITPNSVVVLNNANSIANVNLDNATISGANDDTLDEANVPFNVVAGVMNLKGGVISAFGTLLDADDEVIHVMARAEGENAELNIVGTTFEVKTGKRLPLYAEDGAKLNLTNVTINGAGNNLVASFAEGDVVVNDSSITGEYLLFFSSNSNGVSKITINGGNYTATVSNLLGVHGGEIVVKDGEFICDSAEKTFKFYNIVGSKIVLEGGTFNGVAFEDLTETMLQGWVNKSDIGSSTIRVAKVGNAWEITLIKA